MKLYVDSSALIKAFVPEEERDTVLELLTRATGVATSRIAYVECRAALSRAKREGRLRARGESLAARNLDDRWLHLQVVELDESLTKNAGELTRAHALRALDAIHLASADVIAEESREEVTFACWDRRLWEAAKDSGFMLAPSSSP
ncbi:MAG: type II toxin-antitoxin system VapC family toxin [Actinobacteria bacterium]|nr:type II toxin-antitoxin system VapC family toxin [Actinomycetota bacterium]